MTDQTKKKRTDQLPDGTWPEMAANKWQPGQSGNPAGMKPGTKHLPRTKVQRLFDKDGAPGLIDALEAGGIVLEDRSGAEILVRLLWHSVVKAKPKEKVAIAELLLKIGGYPCASQVAPTSPDGTEPFGDTSDEDLEEMVNELIRQRMEQKENGSDDDA